MKDSLSVNEVNQDWIRLEITSDKLRQLLIGGALCVADFRCLDPVSKCGVWRLCLGACARRGLHQPGTFRSPRSVVESRL
jgi:hypothetical protein